ncbi:hypothetical protein HGRIS_006699 [Hohenbuehelia grisea]|uniref:Protein kinase domain-containing protein n=1 Tax=Hohenbuehelia grisea TaxID=104357 RepID=A0ABR3J9R0_9AGAR
MSSQASTSTATRFSSFNLFKAPSTNANDDEASSPPPPPPKDRTYLSPPQSLGSNSKNRRDFDSDNGYTTNKAASATVNTKSSYSKSSEAAGSSSPGSRFYSPKVASQLSAPLLSPSANSSVTNLGASSLGATYTHPSASAVSLVSQVSISASVSGSVSGDVHGGSANGAEKPTKAPKSSGFLRGIMGSKRPVSPNPNPSPELPSPSYSASNSGSNPTTYSSGSIASHGSGSGGVSISPDPGASSAPSVRSVRSMKSMGALKNNVDDASRRARSRLRAAVGFLGGSQRAKDKSPVPSLPQRSDTASTSRSGETFLDMDTIRGSLRGRSGSGSAAASPGPDTSMSSGYVDVNGAYAGGSSAYSQQADSSSDGDGGISTPWNFQVRSLSIILKSPSLMALVLHDCLHYSPPISDFATLCDNQSIAHEQHNVHVDEGLLGLPPSWATQLAEAGYSEEEIIALAARRRQQIGAVNLIKPVPRSTSLRNPSGNGHNRLDSAATGGVSVSSSSTRESSEDRTTSPQPLSQPLLTNYTYPQPPPPPPSLPAHMLQHSSSRGSSVSSAQSRANTPDLPPPQPLNLATNRAGSPRSKPLAPPPIFETPPSTPPRRNGPGANQLFVMNASPGSPPPAYVPGIAGQGYLADQKEKEEDAAGRKTAGKDDRVAKVQRQRQASNASAASSSASGNADNDDENVNLAWAIERKRPRAGSSRDTDPKANVDSTSSNTRFADDVKKTDASARPTSPSAKRRSKRFTALPPRLSLKVDIGGGDDLSSWSEAIISAIPTTAEEDDFKADRAALATGASSTIMASAKRASKVIVPGGRAEPPRKASSNSSRWEREQERVIRERNSQKADPAAKPSLRSPPESSRPSAGSGSSGSILAVSPSPISPIPSPNSIGTLDSTRAVILEEIMHLMRPGGGNGNGSAGSGGSGGLAMRHEEPALSDVESPTLPTNSANAPSSLDDTVKVRVSVFGQEDGNGTPSIIQSQPDAERARSPSQDLAVDDNQDSSRLSAYLAESADGEKRDANRDSNMSTMSTATVTNATIVRTASAVANVKVIAPRANSPGSIAAPSSGATSPTSSAASHSSSGASSSATMSPKGAGKRGELTIGPAALVTGANNSLHLPITPSPTLSDVYGGIAASPPDSGNKPETKHKPFATSISVAERVAAFGGGKSPLLSPSSTSPSSAGVQAEGHVHPASPQSSHFGSSEESSWSGGTRPSSAMSQEQQTPTTDAGETSPTATYNFKPLPQPGAQVRDVNRPPALESSKLAVGMPSASGASLSPSTARGSQPNTPSSSGSIPLSPFQRYEGWLSKVVKPLEGFIDEAVDPRDFYLDMQEIAEGENGSVFSAHLVPSKKLNRLKLPPLVKARDVEELAKGQNTLVAMKVVPILPSGSPKLDDLKHELELLNGRWHENVLGMDAVYVDLVEDSLWIRMELMERSLADVVALVSDGLMLQERMIARFASDILLALQYLRTENIAHRDVRSDNLLLNSQGILKLGDFSNAIQLSSDDEERSDIVGVPYWQAPEVRNGPYRPFKVDVWSLGATVWEMAQSEPPFASNQKLAARWPPLSQPDLYSPSFHDFLRLCSEPASNRPEASDLIKKSFVQNACGRPVIIQLLSQCMAIESTLQEADDSEELA